MTYIEFFDKADSENVCACLTYVPDRVIYIGDNSKVMKRRIANYARVFTDRGHSIEFLYKTVSKSNLDNAIKVLSEIVETYEDCVFDITGGEEILNLALGVVYAQHPEKNIQIHRINLRNNTVYDCDKDGNTIYKNTPSLSIEENIRIYGGEVAYGEIDEDKTYKWALTPDFLKDVHLMWKVCKGDVRYWNMQIGILEGAEEVGTVTGMTTVVSKGALERYLERHHAKYKKATGIIAYLMKNGLLTAFDDEGETLTVSYKNPQVKKCLTKAGQILEMRVYITARELVDDGQPIYTDALNGVLIDWDGKLHEEEDVEFYDTENEIDVFLMHNMVPVFISCKNGVVKSDELYKLAAVAERFGGPYGKKVLITTSLQFMGEAGEYLRQRAKDMDIKLIENIQEMEDPEFEKKLKTLWCSGA